MRHRSVEPAVAAAERAWVDALGGRRIRDVPLEELRAMPPAAGGGADLFAVSDRVVPLPHVAIRLRIYTPRRADALPVLVYAHGGGWSFGGVDHVDRPCRDIAAGADSSSFRSTTASPPSTGSRTRSRTSTRRRCG